MEELKEGQSGSEEASSGSGPPKWKAALALFIMAALFFGGYQAYMNWIPNLISDVPAVTVHQYESNKFISDWLVCGPFKNYGADKSQHQYWYGFDVDFLADEGGEWHIEPRRGMTHKSEFVGWVEWQLQHAETLDFTKIFPNNKERHIAYAACYIAVPEETEVLLLLGSDDGVKVWINEHQVWNNMRIRGVRKDEDQVRVTLKPGLNRVLTKVCSGHGGWGLVMRFRDV
jgi:hypothetical protein